MRRSGVERELNALTHGHVRAGQPEDAERIAVIHVRSWQAAYRGLLPQDYLDQLDPAERVERWRRTLCVTDRSAGGVLVAVKDGQVCGATWFGPTRDTDTDPAEVGEVMGIYLLPDAWGQGLGRTLMAAAVEHLADDGYSQVTLWVLESNARARRFYSRAGWAEDGAVKQDDRLGFPITEVRYRRQLPPASEETQSCQIRARPGGQTW
jgi:RimJ/RimL family protein N-acetyltransferase